MVDAARIGGSVPSYQHSLPLLGQFLNQQQGSRAVIAEVDTGFLIIYFKGNRWTNPMTLTVHHCDLLDLHGAFEGSTAGRPGVLLRGGDKRNRKHAACPMGYDVFFRAVGDRLQRRRAAGLTICDTGQVLYVSYWIDKATFVVREGRRRAVSSLQLETYDAEAVKQLLKSTAEVQAREMTRYELGLKLNPNDHITMLEAATLLEADGNYREAEALLARIVAAVPRHPEAYYHIARLALVRGDRRAALSAAKKSVALRPDDPAVADLYGRVLHQSNKNKEAVAALQRALELDPENGLYHYHLAGVYETLGRPEDAEAEMTLSAVQLAAPSWDMVQEDIEEIEIRPQVPALQMERLPAESALLPPAPDGVVLPEPMTVPTMTTTFEPALSAWPSSTAAHDHPAEAIAGHGQPTEAIAGQPAAPKLTPFPEAAAPPLAASAQEDALPLTLEQRLRLAREAPFQSTSRVSRPASQPLLRRPTTQSLNTPPVEVSLGDVPPMEEAVPPAPSLQRPGPMAPQARHLASTAPLTPDRSPSSVPPASVAPSPPAMPSGQPAPSPAGLPPGEDAATATAREDIAGAISGSQAPSTASAPVGEIAEPARMAVIDARPRSAPAQPRRPDELDASAVELAADILAAQRAVAADPNRADLHRKLGFLLARQGKTSEAAEEFRKALQVSRTTL